jgi:hypothetical protein
MDDDDDYLDDDFVLDDALLEALNASEAKYAAQTLGKRPFSQLDNKLQLHSTQTHDSRSLAHPPTKKVKVTPVQNRVSRSPPSSSPPEIVVTADGRYEVSKG